MSEEGAPGAVRRRLGNVVTLRTAKTPVSALAIAEQTARAIEVGEYQPGQRLREQALADRFGCSRAPVREALRILESQGMVVIEPMKGARIAAVDDATFYEVFLIRRALAGLMAQRAAHAPLPVKLAFIDAAERMSSLVDEPPEGFLRGVRRAIVALMGAANTPRTVQLVRGLTFGREAYQMQIFAAPENRRAHALGWAMLARAVADGDARAARDCTDQLFDQGFAIIDRTERAARGDDFEG